MDAGYNLELFKRKTLKWHFWIIIINGIIKQLTLFPLMPPFDAPNLQSLLDPLNMGYVLYTSSSGQGDMYTIDYAMFPVQESCV